MTLIGDFMHNFTDGMSIGVSFRAGYRLGMVTTIAMFFHEIPHEVGDFAILFKLKYNLCKILMFQFVTSSGAMLGTLFGSYIG